MAKASPKKSGVHVNLMLTEELHRKVSTRAQQNHFTVNNMVRVMILEYLERHETRALDAIKSDMEIAWGRFSARFTRLELEEQIVDALAGAQSLDDLARVKSLAKASQSIRTLGEQREQQHLAKAKVPS